MYVFILCSASPPSRLRGTEWESGRMVEDWGNERGGGSILNVWRIEERRLPCNKSYLSLCLRCNDEVG